MTPRNRTIRPPELPPWRARDSGARAARWNARLVRRVVPERRRRRRQRRPRSRPPTRSGSRTSSSVDAVIFNGGYGYDYVKFAADQVKKQKDFSGVTVKVSPSTQIAQQLQPRFVGGNPPDLIDNSGANAIGFSTIRDAARDARRRLRGQQLRGHEDRGHALPEREGPGHLRRQVRRDELRADGLRLWYSAIAVPAERLDRRRRPGTRRWPSAPRPRPRASTSSSGARRRRRTTRRWPSTPPSRRAATRSGWRWRTSSRTAGRSRSSRASSRPSARSSTKGYFVPGGAGTQFTAAQAKWSNDEQAILYPSGGWIENEMKDADQVAASR